ncbi:MAG TPA: hypothetical protein VKX25_03510 [Bryobacteraceae bacterium]|nr:hypothetical protein [Bryobacteraceae bacterium]
MNNQSNLEAFGTGGHKAIFDIAVSFKTELPVDDKSARALIDALTDYIRSKVPGSGDPEVSIKQK